MFPRGVETPEHPRGLSPLAAGMWHHAGGPISPDLVASKAMGGGGGRITRSLETSSFEGVNSSSSVSKGMQVTRRVKKHSPKNMRVKYIMMLIPLNTVVTSNLAWQTTLSALCIGLRNVHWILYIFIVAVVVVLARTFWSLHGSFVLAVEKVQLQKNEWIKNKT